MAVTNKRKAVHAMEVANDTKRLRIKTEQSRELHGDTDDSSEYNEAEDSYSEEDYESKASNTPVTPFSPAPRAKFPSELKTIKCTYEGCTKTFNRPARLEAHLRSHKNERPFICIYEGCGKSYLQEKHLQVHIKGSHTHERSYQCDWEGCGKSFLTATRLRRHKEAHEGRDRFRCTDFFPCNQTLRKHQTLQRHIRSYHLNLAPYPCTLLDPLTSQPCQAAFDGASGLRRHEETIHSTPQFFCNECTTPGQFTPSGIPTPLGFKSQKQLTTHIQKSHANCPFCTRKLSSQRELQKHIESQHSSSTLSSRKNVPCTFPGCHKTFTKKSNLTTHIHTAHNGQRFICGTYDLSSTSDISSWDFENKGCGKDFFSKASLEDHVRTAHLGLPSLVNANRKKKSVLESVDEEGRITKRRSKKQKPSALEEFLGLDERRNIPCLVEGCGDMFIREFDLEKHLRTKHRDMEHGFEQMLGENMIDEGMFEYPPPNGEMSDAQLWFQGAGDMYDEEQRVAEYQEQMHQEAEMSMLFDHQHGIGEGFGGFAGQY